MGINDVAGRRSTGHDPEKCSVCLYVLEGFGLDESPLNGCCADVTVTHAVIAARRMEVLVPDLVY